MNCTLIGFNSYQMLSLATNAQAQSANFPHYIFTYVSAAVSQVLNSIWFAG